jgi:hypothetical protein
MYVIQEAGSPDIYKIGISGISIDVRRGTLQTGNWRQLIIVASIDMPSNLAASRIESCVFKKLAAERIRGEWFRVDLKTALRLIGDAIVEEGH